MINVTLEQIKNWIDCEIDEKHLKKTINGVSIDSRKINEGALFIPFKGENVDGHRFITQALNDGAGAVFSEKRINILKEPRSYYLGRRYFNSLTAIGKSISKSCES